MAKRPAILKAFLDRYEADTGERPFADLAEAQRAFDRLGEDYDVHVDPKWAQLVAMGTGAQDEKGESYVAIMMGLEWSCCETPSSRPFLAADTAISVVAPDPRGTGLWLIGAGMGLPGVEIAFPLSPELALVLSRARRPERWKVAPARLRDMNERIAAAANRAVVASIKSRQIAALVARVSAWQGSQREQVLGVDLDEETSFIGFLPQPSRLSRNAPKFDPEPRGLRRARGGS